MLSRYNAIDIELALNRVSPAPPFPPARDRPAWDAVRQAVGETEVAAIIAQAEADAATPIAPLTASLWLEFVRIGQREGYEGPARWRREALRNMALAECLEGQGRFLEPLLNLVWAVCEESSWSWPAHQRELTDMERPIIDLSVAMTGFALAEFDALLGDQLDPLVGKRIRHEVNRRCFVPYLTQHYHWWLYNTQQRRVNNWNAVCNAGVVGAAMYLEPDPARLAEMIARAARSLDDYLATFDADGGSTEGPGYWSYGFGYFTLIAHLVEHRTEGQVSFWSEPVTRLAAQFPLRVSLSPGTYVNFSDADRHVSFVPAHLVYLARRLDLPDLERQAAHETGTRRELMWGLRSLFWRPGLKIEDSRLKMDVINHPSSIMNHPSSIFSPPVPSRHDWFAEMMWLFARFDPTRPDALTLAAKGGHNGEMHNQNDVGNFIVHVKGESVIADVGRGRYTRFYFGPERYDHFVNSSRGHSVPVPNGQVQRPGAEYRASLLEHRADDGLDLLRLDLEDAYPAEADLAVLERTVALHRDPPEGWVELADRVQFAGGPGTLDSVLTTFGQVEVGAEEVVVRGERGAVRVGYDAGQVTARVDVEREVDLSEGRRDVNCVVFSLRQPATEGEIRLRITPL